MDRHWLLTWTTYGTWLPGDERGFVSYFRDADGEKVILNAPHTPCAAGMPALRVYAASLLKEPVAYLNLQQAEGVAEQLHETAAQRGWLLLAFAVMANHVHVVVGVPGDPDSKKLLADFKGWGTRRLRRGWPGRTTWWTDGGSRRVKRELEAIRSAVRYVAKQPHALVIWVNPLGKELYGLELSGGSSPAG